MTPTKRSKWRPIHSGHRTRRLLIAVILAIASAGALLLTSAEPGASPEVVEAHFEMVPVVVRGPGGENPRQGSLLSTKIRVRFPSMPRGARIEVSRVEYYSESGGPLGGTVISSATPSVTSWLPGFAPSDAATNFAVPPLSPAELSFRASPEWPLILEPGAKIYAEIHGRVGSSSFRARSAVGAVSGLRT